MMSNIQTARAIYPDYDALWESYRDIVLPVCQSALAHRMNAAAVLEAVENHFCSFYCLGRLMGDVPKHHHIPDGQLRDIVDMLQYLAADEAAMFRDSSVDETLYFLLGDEYYDKFYVLAERLLDEVNNLVSGGTSAWIPQHSEHELRQSVAEWYDLMSDYGRHLTEQRMADFEMGCQIAFHMTERVPADASL